MKAIFSKVQPAVFFPASFIIFLLCATALVFTQSTKSIFSNLQAQLSASAGWFYILTMSSILIFIIYLLLSPFGAIRLGSDESRPRYGLFSWFAMLFSAGMGIGLLFYGVAEPILHYLEPIKGQPESIESARNAMGLTFFHWGLHPWACYALVGLSLAYFGFRKQLPFSLRSLFYPLLKERIYGWPGHIIDTLAIVSTLFGVATSLGLGAMQVNSGLNYVFGLEISQTSHIIIITCITFAATLSVVSGLDVGIKRLSEMNLLIALFILLFVFFMGPTLYLLNSIIQNIGYYLQTLPSNSFWTAALDQGAKKEWLGDWTIFYWSWWIAWAPFVGMFIGRISEGRTIREFILGVLLVPTIVGFIWMTVFGNSSLYLELFMDAEISTAVKDNISTAIFVFLDYLPLSVVSSFMTVICITLFFVTSSDSASLVIDTLASGGRLNPPVIQRVYWALLEGFVAALLLVAGGLGALQAATISTALPFSMILILLMISLHKSLKQDYKILRAKKLEAALQKAK